MRINYKRPTKGNPHEITVKQHIHAARFIKKFAGEDGRVKLFERKSGDFVLRSARPEDACFCTYRRWDHTRESDYCVSIESTFARALDHIINGGHLEQRDHQAITEYYCLWQVRAHLNRQPRVDYPINGLAGVISSRSEVDRELLEKRGYATISPDRTMEGHFVASFQLIRNVDLEAEKMKDVKWAAIRSDNTQFICADSYLTEVMLPVTPTLVLIPGEEDSDVNAASVAEINAISRSQSTRFYFCRNHESCPFPETRANS